MSDFLLLRYEDEGKRTFGVLKMPDDELLHTLECPWQDNEPWVSCIPSGRYSLAVWESPKHGRCLKIIGCEPERTNCLFHAGNVVEDVTGCIAVGTYRGTLTYSPRKLVNAPAVLSSRKAMERLMKRAEGFDRQPILEIRDALGRE